MTVRRTVSAANAIHDSGTSSAFSNIVAELYSGPQPASANSLPTGTLLWSVTKLGAYAADAVGGHKVATSLTSRGLAAGDAGWYRVRQTSDGSSTDGSDERIDGSVTATGGGGDLVLDNVNIASGQTVTLSRLSITL